MKHTLTSLAQELRKNQTEEEARLWYQFLRKYPQRFRRQHPFGSFIVDFYCSKAKLVVELDGSQHYDTEAKIKDAASTSYLENLGLRVIRFSNADINLQFQNVCTAIDLVVKERITQNM